MSVPGEFTAGDVLAAVEMNALPGGVLGYAATTTPQTGISSLADLTGLSVAVVVPAGRLVRITGHVQATQRSATGTIIGWVREGSTNLNRFGMITLPLDANNLFEGSAVVAPSAGGHTYKLSFETSAGTVEAQTTAGRPNFILVEALGPDPNA